MEGHAVDLDGEHPVRERDVDEVSVDRVVAHEALHSALPQQIDREPFGLGPRSGLDPGNQRRDRSRVPLPATTLSSGP